MPFIFSEADLACMQRLKDAFNPTGLCNPGKIFPSNKACVEVGPSPTARIRSKRRASPSASSAGVRSCPCRAALPRQAAHASSAPPTCSPAWTARRTCVEGRTPEAAVFPGTKEEVAAVLVAGRRGRAAGHAVGRRHHAWRSARRPTRLGLVLGLKRLDRHPRARAGRSHGHRRGRACPSPPSRPRWASAGSGSRSIRRARPSARRVGGMLASNASGPRRHLYGTARDLLIGLTVVMADGSLVRGGGKVVKNVAGYDLPKLFIGSFGTLGVLVEATLKLRPRARRGPARGRALRSAQGRGRGRARGRWARTSSPPRSSWSTARRCARLGLGGAAPRSWSASTGIARAGGLAVRRAPAPARRRSASARPRVLDGPARDEAWRGAGALGARRASSDVAAVMKWAVLPTQVAEVMEQGARGRAAQRPRGRVQRARRGRHRHRRCSARRRRCRTRWCRRSPSGARWCSRVAGTR